MIVDGCLIRICIIIIFFFIAKFVHKRGFVLVSWYKKK